MAFVHQFIPILCRNLNCNSFFLHFHAVVVWVCWLVTSQSMGGFHPFWLGFGGPPDGRLSAAGNGSIAF